MCIVQQSMCLLHICAILIVLHNFSVFWLIVAQFFSVLVDCCTIFPRHEWRGNRACTAPMGTARLFGSHETPNDDDRSQY